jgi:hypothetical protein
MARQANYNPVKRSNARSSDEQNERKTKEQQDDSAQVG